MEHPCPILAKPEEELGYLIWQIMKIWQRGKHKLLDEFGITASQLEVLSAVYHLSKEEQEVTQISISNVTNVDPMTTSTILRNLQKKKLISRRASTIDTRARVVEITNEGSQLLTQTISKVHESTQLILDNMDGEALTNQLRLFLDVLNKLKN